MKTRILSLAIALIALFAFSSAYAQNPHLVGNLTYSVVPCGSGQIIQVSGKIAGLGNTVTSADVAFNGTFDFQYNCINPSQVQKERGKPVPGQSGSTNLSDSDTYEVRNGRVEFTFETECMNFCNPNNWTFMIPANSVSLRPGATIVVNGYTIYL